MNTTEYVLLQFGEPGGMELAVILLIAILLFGMNKIPMLWDNLVVGGIESVAGATGPGKVTRQDLMEIDDSDFEELVAAVWEGEGYAVQKTGGGSDRGIDVIANSNEETVVIEAKRYQEGNKVSAPTVQKAVGAREQFQADRVVVVTSSDFTEPARRAAADTGVELVNGRETAERLTNIIERAHELGLDQ